MVIEERISLIETPTFDHPAAWLLQNSLRIFREQACLKSRIGKIDRQAINLPSALKYGMDGLQLHGCHAPLDNVP